MSAREENIPCFRLDDGTSIPVSVETSRSRRGGYSIRLDARGLRVLLPPGSNPLETAKHLERHRRWINNRFREKRAAEHALPKIADGALVPLMGGAKEIRMAEGETGKGRFTEEAFLYPENIKGDEREIAIHLANAYIEEAWKRVLEKLAAPELREFLPMLREIRLKEIKSRWGSCSAKGGLSISWRPIMAPAEVFDYLLVHELCHLLERGHTPRFWAEVEKRCPEHRAARRYLREKHFELTNFPIPLGPAKTFARFAPR